MILYRIIPFLKKHHPDVILLQEVLLKDIHFFALFSKGKH